MSINFVRKGFGSWTAAVLLLVLGFAFTGCASHDPKTPKGKAAAAPVLSEGSVDRVGVGDTLIVEFSDTPEKFPPFEDKVKETGTMTLIHNQTFVVTNKTRAELEVEIRERYVPDYYKLLTVKVTHSGQSRFYYVGGEVRAPARQVYIGPITVTKAIQTAGDFTDFAKKSKVRLTRANGHVQIVDCKKALVNPALDLEVYPGDKITVPRRFW